MKTKILLFLTMVLLVVMVGCKKDEKPLQPTATQQLLHEETIILEATAQKVEQVILPKMDYIRTTLQKYVMWENDTIIVHGPGGYTPTAKKGNEVHWNAYQMEFMPDTVELSTKGDFAQIIGKFLELRRQYEQHRALKKLWICIPKILYDMDPEYYEWFLTEISAYMTRDLGGAWEWSEGVRNLEREKQILYLEKTPDPNDPWGMEHSAYFRRHYWYLQYAQGPEKTAIIMQNAEKLVLLKAEHAGNRYMQFASSPDKENVGNVEDYETKSGVTMGGQEVYYLEIPNIPTK